MPLSVDTPWTGHDPSATRSLVGEGSHWWICGGWAIDLWLGRQSRAHADTDIGCFRQDVPRLLEALRGWTVYEAADGRLRSFEPTRLHPAVTSLWCHRPGSGTWDLQVMIEEATAGQWRYRRDDRISLPPDRILWTSDGGLQVLQPEVQLLYKSADPRHHDTSDLRNVMPTLDDRAITWLRDAIRTVHPQSPWLSEIA